MRRNDVVDNALERGLLWSTDPMGELWVPWAVVALLVVGMVAGVIWVRRDRRRLRDEGCRSLDLQAEESQRVLSEQAAAYQNELTDRDLKVLTATDERDLFRKRAARQIGSEQVSRSIITAVCRELGVNGLLATNVTFVPFDANKESPFITQIDHVVLTESGALVIESKYWRGVVFDSVLPSRVHEAFGALIPDEMLRESFAVRIARDPATHDALNLLTCTGRRAPRSQVRLHAKRLSTLVEELLGRKCWFDTVVFYSHPEAVVFAPGRSRGSRRAAAEIAVGKAQLHRTLSNFLRANRAATLSPVEQIAPLLEELGADLVGFGSYADRWRGKGVAACVGEVSNGHGRHAECDEHVTVPPPPNACGEECCAEQRAPSGTRDR